MTTGATPASPLNSSSFGRISKSSRHRALLSARRDASAAIAKKASAPPSDGTGSTAEKDPTTATEFDAIKSSASKGEFTDANEEQSFVEDGVEDNSNPPAAEATSTSTAISDRAPLPLSSRSRFARAARARAIVGGSKSATAASLLSSSSSLKQQRRKVESEKLWARRTAPRHPLLSRAAEAAAAEAARYASPATTVMMDPPTPMKLDDSEDNGGMSRSSRSPGAPRQIQRQPQHGRTFDMSDSPKPFPFLNDDDPCENDIAPNDFSTTSSKGALHGRNEQEKPLPSASTPTSTSYFTTPTIPQSRPTPENNNFASSSPPWRRFRADYRDNKTMHTHTENSHLSGPFLPSSPPKTSSTSTTEVEDDTTVSSPPWRRFRGAHNKARYRTTDNSIAIQEEENEKETLGPTTVISDSATPSSLSNVQRAIAAFQNKHETILSVKSSKDKSMVSSSSSSSSSLIEPQPMLTRNPHMNSAVPSIVPFSNQELHVTYPIIENTASISVTRAAAAAAAAENTETAQSIQEAQKTNGKFQNPSEENGLNGKDKDIAKLNITSGQVMEKLQTLPDSPKAICDDMDMKMPADGRNKPNHGRGNFAASAAFFPDEPKSHSDTNGLKQTSEESGSFAEPAVKQQLRQFQNKDQTLDSQLSNHSDAENPKFGSVATITLAEPTSKETDEELKYYRIVYRGVVALLSDPRKAPEKKSGAYVSYGEIIASFRELEVPSWEDDNNDTLQRIMPAAPIPLSPTASVFSDRSSLSGIGKMVSSPKNSSSLPLAPLTVSSRSAEEENARRVSTTTAIRVDNVLTGGYAMDGEGVSGSSTAHSNNVVVTTTGEGSECVLSPASTLERISVRRNIDPTTNHFPAAKDNVPENTLLTIERRGREIPALFGSAESTRDPQHHRRLSSNSSTTARPHHGFLLLRRGDVVVAERITGPPPACEFGTFFYKVSSSTPVPILSGPSIDAPRTRAMVLPGTIHEISLRMSAATSDASSDNRICAGTVVFLRLCHRRGWVADRKWASPRHGRPRSRVSIVMKEILPGSSSLPLEQRSLRDDFSIGSISVKAASVATPRTMVRRRRPPRRKRGDDGSESERLTTAGQPSGKDDLTMSPSSRRPAIAKDSTAISTPHHAIVGIPDSVSSPVSNISFLSEESTAIHHSLERNAAADGVIPKRYGTTQNIGRSMMMSMHRAKGGSSNSSIPGLTKSYSSSPTRTGSTGAPTTTTNMVPSKCFFLMRVLAPNGLKVLDAPHFQVNKLIHGQSSNSFSNTSKSQKPKPLGTSAFPAISSASLPRQTVSILQSMAGSFVSMDLSRTAQSSSNDNDKKSENNRSNDNNRTRILSRGTLFEASKRMESTSGVLFSSGAGLIKLADNSGWAIIPHVEDLEAQYQHYHRQNGGVDGDNDVIMGMKPPQPQVAFEEVGNALVFDDGIPTRSFGDGPLSLQCSSWLRIHSRNGAAVHCPPPPVATLPEENNNDSRSMEESESPLSSSGMASCSFDGSHPEGRNNNSAGPITSQESDVASSVGSAILDAIFRSPLKNEHQCGQNHPEAAFKEKQLGEDDGNTPLLLSDKHLRSVLPSTHFIPCGMCVEIDRWDRADSSPGKNENQFVRLRGGQGWIARMVNNEVVGAEVDPPKIRTGSFWFRVCSERGIKVRRGPSRRSNSIKSEDNVYFRFECGEFLRASEILTIFLNSQNSHQYGTNHQEVIGSFDQSMNSSTVDDVSSPKMESFAKLYRKIHEQPVMNGVQSNESLRFRPLSSIASAGEWVQIQSNEKVYLKECSKAPSIERHREGWRYNAVSEVGVKVRKGPSFVAEPTGKMLQAGESVLINERVTAFEDRVTWLRLKDGQGWIHDVSENKEVVMIAHFLHHRTKSLNKDGEGAMSRRSSSEMAYNALIGRVFHNDGGADEP